MKKLFYLLLIITLIICLSMVSLSDILAVPPGSYNGTGTPAQPAGGACGEGNGKYCLYSNATGGSAHQTVKITFVYIDNGGNPQPVTSSAVVFSNNKSGVYNVTKVSVSGLPVGMGSKLYGTSALRDYYMDPSNNYANFNNVLGQLGVNVANLDFSKHEREGGKRGYRLLIEPMVTVRYSGSTYHLVPINGLSDDDIWNTQSVIDGLRNTLTLQRDDVGWTAGKKSYNLIDIPEPLISTCPSKKANLGVKDKSNPGYAQLINDAAYALGLPNFKPEEDTKKYIGCFKCEEYLAVWDKDSDVIKKIKDRGLVDWSSSECRGDRTCKEEVATAGNDTNKIIALRNKYLTYNVPIEANQDSPHACFTCDQLKLGKTDAEKAAIDAAYPACTVTCKQEVATAGNDSSQIIALRNKYPLYNVPTDVNNTSPFACFTCDQLKLGKTDAEKAAIDAAYPGCGTSKNTNTCSDFKRSNPNVSYLVMLIVNSIEWPDAKKGECYTCDDPTFKAFNPDCNPEPDVDLCNFDLNISIPNKCTVKTTGYVQDMNNWGCIFVSDKSDDVNIRDHFYKWTNSYCSVYCREEVDYQFPNNGMTVLAGRHFTVGNSIYHTTLEPIRFTSTTECRSYKGSSSGSSANINYAKFREEWIAADKTVKEKWDAWQIAIKKDEAIDDATQVSDSEDCNSTCDSYHPTYSCDTGTCGGGCSSSSYKNHMQKPKKVSYDDGTGDKDVTPDEFCDNSIPKYVENHQADYNSALTTRTNLLSCLKDCNNFQFTNKDFNPSVYFKYEEAMYGNLDNGKNAYTLDNRDNASITSDTRYYTGGSPITGEGTPASTPDPFRWGTSSYKNASADFLYATTTPGRTTTVPKYVCETNGETCKIENETYQTNDWIKQTTTKIYNYHLPPGVYPYISKPSGLSVNTTHDAEKYSNQYYSLGYSSLPVHYSRKTGTYKYEMDYDSLGTNHKFNKYVFDEGLVGISYGSNLDIYNYLWNTAWASGLKLKDMMAACTQGGRHMHHDFVSKLGSKLNDFKATPCYRNYNCRDESGLIKCYKYYRNDGTAVQLGDHSETEFNKVYAQIKECINSKVISTTGRVAFNGTTKYECTYNVKNKIIECPPGKNCDLNVIFRPISLTNPFPGMNGTGRSPGDNWSYSGDIQNYITKNRGVNDYSIYRDRDPMYKITLTPALIKDIREYNKIQKNKQTTTYDNAFEQSVTKLEGYSDFELTCVSAGKECKSDFIRGTVDGYKFSEYFTGCGIVGENTGLRCVSGEAW